MADRDVPTVAQAAANEVGKIVEKYMPADEPPTADGAALQGAFVLSLGYILQRGPQSMPNRATQWRLVSADRRPMGFGAMQDTA